MMCLCTISMVKSHFSNEKRNEEKVSAILMRRPNLCSKYAQLVVFQTVFEKRSFVVSSSHLYNSQNDTGYIFDRKNGKQCFEKVGIIKQTNAKTKMYATNKQTNKQTRKDEKRSRLLCALLALDGISSDRQHAHCALHHITWNRPKE